ncbi:MAG: hypothetical protein ABIS18_05830 [Actinomycetota bacterium]
MHGTSRTILATDYNFYVNQRTGGDSNQALASYMDYFLSNYHGDRAPVTISHHFTRWNNGAYVEALTRFVLQVCPMPDVRCVSYRDLAKWLNTY